MYAWVLPMYSSSVTEGTGDTRMSQRSLILGLVLLFKELAVNLESYGKNELVSLPMQSEVEIAAALEQTHEGSGM